ncbi:MAG: hypothetical protein H0X39_00890 [Actinobacteria bacterium]|nr:hypothetical protein [Actinomycetota bacterium]
MQVADLYAGLSLKVDGSSWAKGDSLVKGMKTGVIALGAAAIAGAVGLYEGAKSVIDLGSALNDTAQKTGMTVEGLQELGYVAKLNSSSMEEVAAASTKLSRGLAESAKTGSGPAADGLAALHLKMSDIMKLPVDQRMEVIAQAIAKMPDGAAKTAASMNLFGKSGASLIPTLNDLGKNGTALRAEFKAMGGELSGSDAAGLDDLGDNIDRTKAQLNGLKTQVVVALMPQIKLVVDSVMGWVKANKDLIASGIHTFVDGLVAGFRVVGDVIGIVITGVTAIADVFKAAFDGDAGAIALLTGLGGVLLAVVVPAIWTMVSGWWAMVPAVVAATWPVIAIGLAVAAVTYGVVQLIKHWPQVKAAARSAFDWIAGKASSIKNTIVGVGAAIYDFFAGIGSAIKAAVQTVIDWIDEKIDAIIKKVHAAVATIAIPGNALGDAAFNAIHGDGIDHSDENQDQSAAAIARRQAANTAYYQQSAPSAGATSSTNVTNNVTVNAAGADSATVGKHVANQIGLLLRDTGAAVGAADR